MGVLSCANCGAALGSRTPDLRMTSTPNPARTMLWQSMRARQSVHRAQERTPQNSIGGHEGGRGRDRKRAPSGTAAASAARHDLRDHCLGLSSRLSGRLSRAARWCSSTATRVPDATTTAPPGSPLLFVRAARQSPQRQVRAIFVERDQQRFTSLCAALDQADPDRRVPRLVRSGGLGEHLPELLAAADGGGRSRSVRSRTHASISAGPRSWGIAVSTTTGQRARTGPSTRRSLRRAGRPTPVPRRSRSRQ